MMKMTRFLLAPLMALVLGACDNSGSQTTPAASTPAAANAANNAPVLRVAIEPIYPPYVLPTETKASFTGYDIDVLTEIAKRANMTITFTPYPWESLFGHLASGSADVVAGGLSPNEERKAIMDFTIPYDETSIVLVVPQDSPIKNFNDAKGKHIAHQSNSSDAKLWEKTQGGTLLTAHATDSAWLSFRSVMTGQNKKADAALGHSAVFAYYLKQYPDSGVKLLGNANAVSEPMAFAVKKGNQALLDTLNKHLEAMKADGSLNKLHDKWIPHTEHHSHHNHEKEGEHKHDEHKGHDHKH